MNNTYITILWNEYTLYFEQTWLTSHQNVWKCYLNFLDGASIIQDGLNILSVLIFSSQMHTEGSKL